MSFFLLLTCGTWLVLDGRQRKLILACLAWNFFEAKEGSWFSRSTQTLIVGPPPVQKGHIVCSHTPYGTFFHTRILVTHTKTPHAKTVLACCSCCLVASVVTPFHLQHRNFYLQHRNLTKPQLLLLAREALATRIHQKRS